MEAMPWEWHTWLYLWAAGVAGGGFFAAFLINLFTGRKYKLLLQIATWIGVPLVWLGVLMLLFDLGNQLRAWHLFVRFLPVSPMSLGSWILLLWSITAVALIALWFSEIVEPAEQPTDVFARIASLLRPLVPASEILGWIAFVLSVLLITYTGVLLSNTNQPMWVSLLLPVLFVVSAVSTGLAAIMLVAILLGKKVPPRLGQAGTVLEILEVLALIAFLVTVPAGVLISGTLSLWFWLGVIGIGLLVPVVLELLTWRTSPPLAVLASTLCVLVGGLILRTVVVIGGQM